MSGIRGLLAAALFISAAGLSVIAAVGLWRVQTTLARVHVATKAAVPAVLLAGTGAIVGATDWATAGRIALALLFQLMTVPVASQLISHVQLDRQRDPSKAVERR